MKLPGMDFLREQRAVKQFESQEPAFRELVFYSEGAGDWPHIGPVIQTLLGDHDRKVSYLTSDENDPGLHLEDSRFRSFNIGSGTARTILFARINCRHFVMTLPDLGNLWLKRSVHPVHYVYLFHSMNSTHTSYRTGAFDQFDTILCVGPHHVDEIRRTEEVYGLRPKELVQHGSVKLDSVLAEVRDVSDGHPAGDVPTVLVAPTWGDSSLIEQPIGREVIAALLHAGYRTVVRLHPMTSRRLPTLVRDLRDLFGADRSFVLEEDMSAMHSWMESSLMISDWSGAATEYALALMKPVIYVDTPPKIMNPEWDRIGLPSFEDQIRRQVGQLLHPDRIGDLETAVRDALAAPPASAARINDVRTRHIFNVGRSASVAGEYLATMTGQG